MAKLAVLASGNGSNFEAIADKFDGSRHQIVCMICNKKDAFVFERAARFGIPSFFVDYNGKSREEAETEIIGLLETAGADLIALAGFMKLLSPVLVDRYDGRIINIHPSLLPKYPGTHGIQDSYDSDDSELGITIHRVDHGLDTGPVIVQKSFNRDKKETLPEIETEIHRLEHFWYPEVLLKILDSIDQI